MPFAACNLLGCRFIRHDNGNRLILVLHCCVHVNVVDNAARTIEDSIFSSAMYSPLSVSMRFSYDG